MQPLTAILETILYARDLTAARAFYSDVLELDVYAEVKDRHIFFKLERQMLLIFNPDATERPPASGALPVPPHGTRGPGHVCFGATAKEIDQWRRRLEAANVGIEADFVWPAKSEALRGRSIYFRDPAGNSVEIAEPRIWGLPEEK